MITFVVRFWRETSAGEVRWRDRIEHVQSGKQADFLQVDGLVTIPKRYGISAKTRSAGGDEDEDRTEDI